MQIYKTTVACLLCLLASTALAFGPEQILVIANSDMTQSFEIAKYYCQVRKVPEQNVLALNLGADSGYEIERDGYNERIAEPVRRQLSKPEYEGKIRCLLTTYGVPIKIVAQNTAEQNASEIAALEKDIEGLKEEKDGAESTSTPDSSSDGPAALLQSKIDRLEGKETSASVDSELSMVLFDNYDLYRWQPNALKGDPSEWDGNTLMVCRLDGPGADIAKGVVDKAMATERKGLKGNAYIDSGYSQQKQGNIVFEKYDQSLVDLALLVMFRTELEVKQERTEAVFQPGSCPDTALYCGWYSVRKYVDAFDFVDGAIGYHIASFEAQELRDPHSTRWCPAMLVDGITATLGPVDEPYLDAFPLPNDFFLQLFNGHCLVEAFYYTKPFNSWQFVLIGDPLYTPFPKR